MDRHLAMETFIRVSIRDPFPPPPREPNESGAASGIQANAQLEEWLGVRLLFAINAQPDPYRSGNEFYVRAKRSIES